MEHKYNPSFNPRECISAKMMALNRVVANIFRKHLKPFGITDSQLTLLFIINHRSDLNQKQLCQITFLEKSSLNRNLNRLFDSGLISKDEFPLLTITTKGHKLVNEILPSWEKAMTEITLMLGNDGEQAINLLSIKLLK